MRLVSEFLIVVLVFLNLKGSEGIRCYVCGKDSPGDGSCAKDSVNGKIPSVECPSTVSGKTVDACGYMIKEEPDGVEIVRRMCLSSKIISDVVSIEGDPMELGRCYNDITVSVRTLKTLTNYKVFCTCASDECNSSSGNSMQHGKSLWTSVFNLFVLFIAWNLWM